MANFHLQTIAGFCTQLLKKNTKHFEAGDNGHIINVENAETKDIQYNFHAEWDEMGSKCKISFSFMND